MKVPESTSNFINLQRSGFHGKVDKFISEINREFEEIKPFLPGRCFSILDIGCGLSTIDIFLSNYYDNAKLFLCDKDKIDNNIHYGYKATGSFYNSFQITKEFLNANEVKNFTFLESEKGEDIPNIGKQDLIISLLSCGYHYSVEFYLKKCSELLSKNGVLVLDIREHTDGIDQIEKVFPIVEIIRHENKARRICARRKIEHRKKSSVGNRKIKREVIFLEKMRWNAILKRIPNNKKMIGAEIGVLHGETACRILRQRLLVTHIMIDPWEVQSRDGSYMKTKDGCSQKPQSHHDTAFKQTKNRMEFAGKRAIIKKMYSNEAVKKIGDKSLDYCFLDGNHSYEVHLEDITLWFPKVISGGWIGGHDYGNKRTPGVKKAVDEFFKGKKIELDYEETWFVRVEK